MAVLTSTLNLCFEQECERYQNFLSENFPFLVVKFSVYLNRRVFVIIFLVLFDFLRNLAVKRNPELNLKLIGNVDHNAEHSEGDLDIRYGADFKDDNKHIEVSLNSDRNFNDIFDVSANGQLRFRHLGQVFFAIVHFIFEIITTI